MTRVLVCGGRDYGCIRNGCPPEAMLYESRRAAAQARLLFDTLDMVKVDRGISVVIHGAATGADALARLWAERQLLADDPYPANWYPNGRKGGLDKSAGPRRNAKMIAEGKPDLVIAFPGGSGTDDCCRRAEAAGIPVIRVE